MYSDFEVETAFVDLCDNGPVPGGAQTAVESNADSGSGPVQCLIGGKDSYAAIGF